MSLNSNEGLPRFRRFSLVLAEPAASPLRHETRLTLFETPEDKKMRNLQRHIEEMDSYIQITQSLELPENSLEKSLLLERAGSHMIRAIRKPRTPIEQRNTQSVLNRNDLKDLDSQYYLDAELESQLRIPGNDLEQMAASIGPVILQIGEVRGIKPLNFHHALIDAVNGRRERRTIADLLPDQNEAQKDFYEDSRIRLYRGWVENYLSLAPTG